MAKDMRGIEFTIGDTVAKGVTLNQAGSAGIDLCKVTRVDGDKIYLDDSKRPMRLPERLLVVNF